MSPSPAPNPADPALPDSRQKTIGQAFSLSGIGIHSGKEAALHFSPAEVNTGVVFVTSGRKVPAREEKVVDTRRGTSLEGVRVVEHLLSAVNGLGIDNLEIAIEGGEVPILDGSALPFARALMQAGLTRQDSPRKYLAVGSPIKISDGEAYIEALPYRGLKINFMVDFPRVGPQKLAFELDKADYEKEIAPARTFGYLEEYEKLKAAGRAFGASFDNALVIGPEGYANPPRFPDEIVRHKVLDLIGDLLLAGHPLRAEINAFKSGHKLNIELVRRIIKS